MVWRQLAIRGHDEWLDEKMRAGQPDAGLNLSAQLSSDAIHLFGIDAIISNGGCPICTHLNVVRVTTDKVARQFKEVH